MLSGRGLCDELITRPEVSYRLWCVVVCDLETSRMRRPCPALGRSTTTKKKNGIGYRWIIFSGLPAVFVSAWLHLWFYLHWLWMRTSVFYTHRETGLKWVKKREKCAMWERRHWKEVGGQLHAPAALYPRERPGTHCTGGWVGPWAGLDKRGKSRLYRDSIPGPCSS